MKNLLIILSLGVFLTSCATHKGTISSGTINKRVKYEDIAIGVAQTNKIFCMGGLTKDALILEAKKKLIKNRPLRPDEAYINFTLDIKKTYLLFYVQTKVTMSADVVKMIDDTINEVYSDNYLKKIKGKSLTNDLFEIGDTVVFNKTKEGTIISIEDIDKVKLLYKTKNDKYCTKNFTINNIHTKS